MDWKAEAEKLKFKQGLSWTETANALKSYFPGLTEHQVRERVRDYLRSTDTYKAGRPTETYHEKTELKADGSFTSDKIIEIHSGEHLTPELLMAKHNIDPAYWQVMSYTNNLWHSQIKGGKRLTMYQSKVTVKPKSVEALTFDYIDQYFEDKDYSKDKLPVECFQYSADGETLEILIPDLHIGLLAWEQETGESYDLKIVKKNFFVFLSDVRRRCEGRKFQRIIFAILGDLLHVDNDIQTTTKGTFQQVDGRLAKIVETAEDMLVDGITMLGDIAPMDVVYTVGNHDKVCGYMLMRSISNAFKRDDRVMVDTSPNPQKFRHFGNVLIGYVHGDMPKKNITTWLLEQARKEFGQSKFVEIHAGHYRAETTMEANGILVKFVPKLCSSSYWEHHEGYANGNKTLVCNVWNDTAGLRETWATTI